MTMFSSRSRGRRSISLFFFNDTATTEIYTLSLHDTLPIFGVFGTSTNSAQVAVTAASLRSSDFLTTNAGITFTYIAASESFITLSNTGTAASHVTAATINWAGQTNSYSLAVWSTCTVGASGSASATQNMLFASAKMLTVSATAGGTFTGSVTLASGAVLIFTGTFQ